MSKDKYFLPTFSNTRLKALYFSQLFLECLNLYWYFQCVQYISWQTFIYFPHRLFWPIGMGWFLKASNRRKENTFRLLNIFKTLLHLFLNHNGTKINRWYRWIVAYTQLCQLDDQTRRFVNEENDMVPEVACLLMCTIIVNLISFIYLMKLLVMDQHTNFTAQLSQTSPCKLDLGAHDVNAKI